MVPHGAFPTLSGCGVRWPRQAPQPSAILSWKLGMKQRRDAALGLEKAKSAGGRAREARIGMQTLPAVTAWSVGESL